jgi:methyl-accepting chemotaxis protein
MKVSLRFRTIGSIIISVIISTLLSKFIVFMMKQFITNELENIVLMTTNVVVTIAIVSIFMQKLVLTPVKKISTALEKMEHGDLQVKIDYHSIDEFGQLANLFNQMVLHMRELIGKANDMSTQITLASEKFSSKAQNAISISKNITTMVKDIASGSETQAQGAEECKRAMEEMSIGIQRIAETSSTVAESSISTTNEAQMGNTSVQKAVHQMDSIHLSVNDSARVVKKLGERSLEIEKIVEVITSISSQTNLLALNAAIEAARAGEHGRGFAVVAEEVRKLAEQSERSAHQITTLIQEIQVETADAVKAMDKGMDEVQSGMIIVNEAGDAFLRILKATEHVSDEVRDVSASSEEMSACTEEVAASVDEISRISRDSAGQIQKVAHVTNNQLKEIEDINELAKSLDQITNNLQKAIGNFKL